MVKMKNRFRHTDAMVNGALFYGHKIDLKQLQEAFAVLCDKYTIDVEALRLPHARAAIKMLEYVTIEDGQYSFTEGAPCESGCEEAYDVVHEAMCAINGALTDSGCSLRVSLDGFCCSERVDSFFIGLRIDTSVDDVSSRSFELPSLQQLDAVAIELSSMGLDELRYYVISDDFCD